jgi:hypothetical protein
MQKDTACTGHSTPCARTMPLVRLLGSNHHTTARSSGICAAAQPFKQQPTASW